MARLNLRVRRFVLGSLFIGIVLAALAAGFVTEMKKGSPWGMVAMFVVLFVGAVIFVLIFDSPESVTTHIQSQARGGSGEWLGEGYNGYNLERLPRASSHPPSWHGPNEPGGSLDI